MKFYFNALWNVSYDQWWKWYSDPLLKLTVWNISVYILTTTVFMCIVIFLFVLLYIF